MLLHKKEVQIMKSINCNEAMNDIVNTIKRASPIFKGLGNEMPTGIKDLDIALYGGLERENLYIIKGRPFSGKTDLVTDIACGLGAAGHKTLMFSIQNDLDKMSQKMLAKISGIPYTSIRASMVSEQDIDILSCSATSCITTNISVVWVIDTVEEIINEACQMKVSGGLDVIIIDSLELIKDKKKNYTKILHSLKNLAAQIDVAVVVVSRITAESNPDLDDDELDPERYKTDILIYLVNPEAGPGKHKIKYNVTLHVYHQTISSPMAVDLAYRPELISFE